MDFPQTRAAIEKLPAWVNELASTLPAPVRVPIGFPARAFSFRWEHQEKTLEVAQVAKAVRLATALRAALALADLRLTTEACSLLRMVGDFSKEITFLGEAMVEDRLTAEQKLFLEQHFAYHPMTPEELAEKERVRYVGRAATTRALGRLLEKAGGPTEEHAKAAAYLSAGFDRFVHGKYSTAMELFSGETMSFMLAGSDSPGQVRGAKVAVAGKTVEAIQALRLMAITRRMDRLARDMNSTALAVHPEHAGP
jgi:hypothetical protein